MKLKCLIIDDERLAQNILEKYISKLSALHLLKKCSNALEAISFMHENPVDVIFLDIDMPEISGLEMLKTLEKSPKVILTTAYSEYALESYDYGVIDYLLKPISFEHFLRAVNRLIGDSTIDKNKEKKSYKSVNDNIIIKQKNISYNVLLSEILYIEAYGNYLNVYTKEQKFIIREKMHIMENKLPSNLFLRVHKSYIISLKRLSSIQGNRIIIASTEIPIGSYYKSKLIDILNEK